MDPASLASTFPLHGGKVSSFPNLVSGNDTVDSKSVMSTKPGDSAMMIGYQFDEFIHTWSAECFVVQSQIYPWFTGMC